MRVAPGRRPASSTTPGWSAASWHPRPLAALWSQRMRWAQGWFQVSCRHLGPILRSPRLTPAPEGRRRPTCSAGARSTRGSRCSPGRCSASWPGVTAGWTSPRRSSCWPRCSSPSPGRCRRWPPGGWPPRSCAGTRAGSSVRGLANLFFYTEFKNLVDRVAHLKQLRGEHQWVVTPRTRRAAPPAPSPTRLASPTEVAA